MDKLKPAERRAVTALGFEPKSWFLFCAIVRSKYAMWLKRIEEKRTRVLQGRQARKATGSSRRQLELRAAKEPHRRRQHPRACGCGCLSSRGLQWWTAPPRRHPKMQDRPTQCHARPSHTMPYHVIPYHILPSHSMLYHSIPVIPCRTMPYHAIPCHTISYHAMLPYHTIPYLTLSSHATSLLLYATIPSPAGEESKGKRPKQARAYLSFHVIPCHTMPYHAIPYHTMPCCHTIPYRTLLYHPMPRRSYYTLPYRRCRRRS